MFNFSQLVVGVLGWTQVCLWVSQIPPNANNWLQLPPIEKGFVVSDQLLGELCRWARSSYTSWKLENSLCPSVVAKKSNIWKNFLYVGGVDRMYVLKHLLWAKENHPSLWSSLADKKPKEIRGKDAN